MRLKKLEIVGFKSFKEKTLFNFSEGISAIVGPNGCGKSNVVDAIRWVMGEQRVKALRGKKMEDVIFNGSEDASPVGLAEVSIVLEKNGRQFPEKYADCSEIMISRRLFRDGESEYHINKVPCRLLDVREFFMDSGVGARTYSIVEQENISKLIEAKPEDIREFIEEAAGIKKYKSRKESAARKMESTRHNIARLKDITGEVKTQMNSTSRQAKRAERYKALRKSTKELELTLSLQAYVELTSQCEALKNSRNSLNEQVEQVRTHLQSLEAQIESIKSEQIEAESSIAQMQERFYTVKNETNVTEQKIEFFNGKIRDIAGRKERNLSDVETLRERRETLKNELESLNDLIIETDTRIAEIKHAIERRQEEVDALKNTEGRLTDELDQKKAHHFSIAAEHARLKNIQNSLTRGIEDLRRKVEREARELNENTRKLESVRNALVDLKTNLEADVENLEALRERKNIAKRDIEEARSNLERIDENIATIKEAIGTKSSRLNSLKEFQQGYEWCNEGTKSILTAQKEGGLPTDGIYGLVADHIEVPKEYEVAVEAVLGEKLQYVVVKSQEDGIEAIDYLKKCSSGRGNFVPLEVRNHLTNSRALDHLTGIVRLDTVIRTKEDFKRIVEFLLGDVLLIPDLYKGVSLWRQNGFCGTFVTPEGDVISPQGVLTGGSSINGGNSLLRNRREIAELEEEISRLTIGLEKEIIRKNDVSTHITRLSEQVDELRADIHLSDLNANSKKKDIERLEGEATWIEQRINVLTFNKESLESEAKEAQETIKQTEQDIGAFETQESEANEVISGLQQQWNRVKAEREDKEKTMTEEKILLTSREEKNKANSDAQTRLNTAIIDTTDEIESNIRDAETADVDVADIRNNISQEEERLVDLYKNHDMIEQALAHKREAHGEKQDILRQKEAEARESKGRLDVLLKDVTGQEMEIQELNVHLDTLKRGVYEKFHVELKTFVPNFNKLDEYEVTDLRTRLEVERKKVEDFGEVNLLALSEHEELKKRYDFLTEQIEDLNASLDTLQKTISRMNRISRMRFTRTFEEVNNSFQKVFPRLFPGGKGELRLTDESNILETGVDIDIQIPGKKRQNVSLLSGGEKAMSAVALIFAILLYKPSPFLILDEVDAALDDRNVSLFKNLLKEISENSQIIFVTHNKRSMEVADNLFGITMEKKGITSSVAVSLN
jgi:chromosome segregation protein